MKRAYTADQVRAAEKPLLDAGCPLMKRAAYGLGVVVLREVKSAAGSVYGQPVVFLVGPGNNGGDALFAALQVARRGAAVTVVLLAPSVHADGLAAVRGTQARIVEFPGQWSTEFSDELAQLVGSATCVVDGILGIGASGEPRGFIGEALECLSALLKASDGSGARRPTVIAVDIASGVDASTGEVTDLGRVMRADVTVTFGAHKVGLYSWPGSSVSGRVELIEIGLDLEHQVRAPEVNVIEAPDFLPHGVLGFLGAEPDRGAHKYTRGVVGIEAGSHMYPGAGILATQAASGTGVGMVRYLGPQMVGSLIVAQQPFVVTQPGRLQALLIGSGMESAESLRDSVSSAVEPQPHGNVTPVVLDAGALGAVGQIGSAPLGSHVILTPHAGELSTLLSRFGDQISREWIEYRPLQAAVLAHELTGATVVLKGPQTVTVGRSHDGDPLTFIQDETTSRLAVAGSGDVLAGIIAGTLALAEGLGSTGHQIGGVRVSYPLLAAAAVMVHSRAGLLASRTLGIITARDVAQMVPHAIADLAGITLRDSNS